MAVNTFGQGRTVYTLIVHTMILIYFLYLFLNLIPSNLICFQVKREAATVPFTFGQGRTVYISGLPYSFENSRILHRAILWSTGSEDLLKSWFSENYNVDVHAYVKNGKFCVVNNTYEPQSTVVYKGDKSSFALDLEANEIRWYNGKGTYQKPLGRSQHYGKLPFHLQQSHANLHCGYTAARNHTVKPGIVPCFTFFFLFHILRICLGHSDR